MSSNTVASENDSEFDIVKRLGSECDALTFSVHDWLSSIHTENNESCSYPDFDGSSTSSDASEADSDIVSEAKKKTPLKYLDATIEHMKTRQQYQIPKPRLVTPHVKRGEMLVYHDPFIDFIFPITVIIMFLLVIVACLIALVHLVSSDHVTGVTTIMYHDPRADDGATP